MGGYVCVRPAQSLPRIISTGDYPASIAAIRSYFTDEQVIRAIAGYVGIDFDTLIAGDYKIVVEPIAYFVYGGAYPDGSYTPYTWLLDCWTPTGMLSMNLTDSVRIAGDLWEEWHIAPSK